MTAASDRLLCADVTTAEVVGDSGPLHVGEVALGEVLGLEVGVWEAGPGTDVDTEVDEVSLVLAGRGSVRFEDGSVLELRPGTLITLRAGDRTTWEVSERLRKLYLVHA